jgi:hypothetical protein
VSLWVDSTSTTPSVAKTLIASGILAWKTNDAKKKQEKMLTLHSKTESVETQLSRSGINVSFLSCGAIFSGFYLCQLWFCLLMASFSNKMTSQHRTELTNNMSSLYVCWSLGKTLSALRFWRGFSASCENYILLTSRWRENFSGGTDTLRWNLHLHAPLQISIARTTQPLCYHNFVSKPRFRFLCCVAYGVVYVLV